LSDARESTKRVKKGVIKELFSEIGVFLVKKGHIRHYTQRRYMKKLRKDMKNLKNMVND